MGTDNKNETETLVYFGNELVGAIRPGITPNWAPTGVDDQPSFNFTSAIWKNCRSRKRYIKLMAGVFHIQRNQAEETIQIAIKKGYRLSYQDLWECWFSFAVLTAIKSGSLYTVGKTKAD
jgi:hypothetical protein